MRYLFAAEKPCGQGDEIVRTSTLSVLRTLTPVFCSFIWGMMTSYISFNYWADHPLWPHSHLFYIFINPTLQFNNIKALCGPVRWRKTKGRHLPLVSCPFCQAEVLFSELVLRLDVEMRVLSVQGESSRLRTAEPGGLAVAQLCRLGGLCRVLGVW